MYHEVSIGRKNVVNNFLRTGQSINTRFGVNGRTLLMGAVSGGYLHVVHAILNAGGRANARNNNGDTPLHYAVRNGSANSLGLLIHHGADVNAKNNMGRTPLMIACIQGSVPMVTHLLEFGANPRMRDNNGDNAIGLTLRNRDPRGRIYIIKKLVQAGAVRNVSNVINIRTNNANIRRLLGSGSITNFLAQREIGKRPRRI